MLNTRVERKQTEHAATMHGRDNLWSTPQYGHTKINVAKLRFSTEARNSFSALHVLRYTSRAAPEPSCPSLLSTSFIKLINNVCYGIRLIPKARQCANHHIPLCDAENGNGSWAATCYRCLNIGSIFFTLPRPEEEMERQGLRPNLA
jgi:hypothetical protein